MSHTDADSLLGASRRSTNHPRWSAATRAFIVRDRERWLASIVVTLFGAALVWPASVGVMPTTGDHPVHFGRAIEFGRALASGTPFTWNPRLGIGVPIGDGYPPLADLLVSGVRAASLGLLPWASAYALAFTLAFVSQGWAMLRLGRALQVRPGFAAVAAVILLLSPGYPREGGWAYGVMLGVWPQLLATAATWWGLAELLLLAGAKDAHDRLRRALVAGLAFALGILAHPITLPVLALALPCVVLLSPTATVDSTSSSPSSETPAARRRARATAWLFEDRGVILVGATISLVVGLALAAWWLVPMLEQRAWMASYGWLHAPLREMLALAARGHFSHAMASVVGWTAAVGALLAIIARSDTARAVAATSVLAWLLASRDTFEVLRLDLLASAFGNLQYQRFVIFAEPGFVMLAATVFQRLWGTADTSSPPAARPEAARRAEPDGTTAVQREMDERSHRARLRGLLGRGGAVVLALACISMTAARAREAGVGGISTQRIPGEPRLAGDLAELDGWLAERATHEPLVRIAFVDGRNLHWFVDAAARLGVRLYKAGFLPGDNFVHKPESSRPEVLDAARVEYVVTRREGPWGAPLKRFGPIRVYARDPIVKLEAVHVEGPGEVVDIEEDESSGELAFTLRGTDDTTRVVLHVPGHPRWEITREGDPAGLSWVEVPMLPTLGERASGLPPDRRRAGEGRDGSARGPDGSEPTFIAVDGPGDGRLALRYRRWGRRDVGALAVTLAALAVLIALFRRPRDPPRLRAPTWGLLALTVLAILAAGAITAQRRRAQLDTVTSRVASSDPNSRPGAIKVDMRLRWAWIVRGAKPRHEIVVPISNDESRLRGWIALDDDAAMAAPRGRRTVFIESYTADGSQRARRIVSLPHLPGRRTVDLDLRDDDGALPTKLRIVVESSGKAPPPIGLSLEVGSE